MQNKQPWPLTARVAVVLAVCVGALAGFVATLGGAKAFKINFAAPATSTPHTVIKSVTPTPTPSPTNATGTVLGTSSALSKAEIQFQKVALATGLKIVQDAANPKSFAEAYAKSMVGNKRLELVHGLEKQPGFPEILIGYYQKERQVSITSITSTNPSAKLRDMHFEGLNLTFQSLDPGPNNLERKLAHGEQLTPADFIRFLRNGNLGARVVQITHGDVRQSSISLAGSVYQYKALGAGSVPITPANYGIMERMGRDIELTELSLRHGL